jgi:RNA-directed DNA polymerase
MSAPSYAWPAARRVAIGQRLRAKLKEVKAELRQRWHDPIPEVGQWLGSVVRGYYQYHGIAGNARAIRRFREEVNRLWHRALGRRSQKGEVTWERMQRLIARWIPRARIVHPWPSVTLAVMTRSTSPVR